MIRGTTPTHIFGLPIETDQLAKVKITYAQGDGVVFTKTEADCTLEGRDVSVTLTQQDTLALDCKQDVKIQLRALTKAGQSLSTLPYYRTLEECLDGEVLE